MKFRVIPVQIRHGFVLDGPWLLRAFLRDVGHHRHLVVRADFSSDGFLSSSTRQRSFRRHAN